VAPRPGRGGTGRRSWLRRGPHADDHAAPAQASGRVPAPAASDSEAASEPDAAEGVAGPETGTRDAGGREGPMALDDVLRHAAAARTEQPHGEE
jgi:hypothetical protein